MRPVARIRADALQRQQVEVTALGLKLVIGTPAEGKLEPADGRLLDVGGRRPRAAELVGAEILVAPEFAVGLPEIRIRRAVGQRRIDVDEDRVGAAVDRVVAVDFDLVGVARDFEKERIADAMAEGHRKVLRDLGLRRLTAGPKIRRRLLRDAEAGRTRDH